MKIIVDDILNAKEKYIAHQCNCVTTYAKGLAKSINSRYPWADAYTNRTTNDIVGTIKIFESPSQDKAVICMFAQFYPSKPIKNSKEDTYKQRIKHFQQCLDEMKKIQTDKIAFPFLIGCGLAGGDWNIYKKMLENFEKETNIEVILYKLN